MSVEHAKVDAALRSAFADVFPEMRGRLVGVRAAALAVAAGHPEHVARALLVFPARQHEEVVG